MAAASPPTWEAVFVSVTPQPAAAPIFVEMNRLPWTSLEIVDELGAAGSATIEAPVDQLDPAVKARLVALQNTPSEVWLRRTSSSGTVMAFAGPVMSCRVVKRTATIVAGGLLAYLGYWAAEANVITALNGGVAATEYVFSGVDQATILRSLIDAWQGLPYGNDGIVTTGLAPTGVPRELTVSTREIRSHLAIASTMGARNNGFDLSVDPAARRIRMDSPRRGVDRTGTVILDRRSIGEPNVAWSVAPGLIGSEVLATSTSSSGATLTSSATNAALRASFGRSFVLKTYQDVSLQATLDDYAARAATDMSTQVFTVSPTIAPVTGFGWGDFGTGDVVTYDYDAGMGRQIFTPRVAKITTKLKGGLELLEVTLL